MSFEEGCVQLLTFPSSTPEVIDVIYINQGKFLTGEVYQDTSFCLLIK